MTRITDNASRRSRASGMNEVVSQDQDRSLPDRKKDGGETPIEPGARVPTQSESFLSVSDFEAEARRRLDPAVFDYIAGGAEDEITVRENEAAFARIGLVPRVLRGGDGKPQIDISLLDCSASLPVVIAPTAFHRLVHRDGEGATARAAAMARTIYIASMAATTAIEEIVSSARSEATDSGAAADVWFQLNPQPDLGFTESLVRRAEAAACRAIVVTVDSPVFGHRRRDHRNGFVELPDGLCCENMRDGTSRAPPRPIVFWPELSWSHVAWLRGVTKLPIVLKGIAHPDDARLAIEHDIGAIIVSNHGGRQLDSVLATIELLPPIAEAVGKRIPIIVDGGIRHGTDIVKAISFGASAVAVGRPVLWGLATAGAEGVSQVLELLRTELTRALILCGCHSLGDVTRDLVRIRQTGNLA
jgi:4-hydroxymandelate oxidase